MQSGEQDGNHERDGSQDLDFRESAREVLDRLREDPDAPSPVARRLREVLLDRLPAERVDVVTAFEREPYAPAASRALESALGELAAADPAFATRVRTLLRGSLGGSDADEQWAERHGGRPRSAVWFLIAAIIALLVVSAVAAFSGPPPALP